MILEANKETGTRGEMMGGIDEMKHLRIICYEAKKTNEASPVAHYIETSVSITLTMYETNESPY